VKHQVFNAVGRENDKTRRGWSPGAGDNTASSEAKKKGDGIAEKEA